MHPQTKQHKRYSTKSYKYGRTHKVERLKKREQAFLRAND